MKYFKIKISNFKSGFTLVEMLVAVGLFTVIASFSIGAVLMIFDANRNARASKTVVDNLNLSLENMVRTVRFGTNYHCDSDEGNGNLGDPDDCLGGGDRLAVTFRQNSIDYIVVYRKCGNAIETSMTEWGEGQCNDPNMLPITSADTVIEYVRFYVLGSVAGNSEQPFAIAVIKGYVGSKPSSQSSFSIQTVMSQRGLDL